MASAPEKASSYNLIRGAMAQSLLATDGYKFSMAEAGWPLRTETFYYSHRKGGPQVLPVDVPAFVRSLLPRPADDDYRYQGGGPTGIIGQEGEASPAGYEAWGCAPADPKYALEFSPETQALQTKLRRTR